MEHHSTPGPSQGHKAAHNNSHGSHQDQRAAGQADKDHELAKTHQHDHTRIDQASNHGDHHRHMVADFRRRFFVCLVVTIPILLLTPMLQHWIGISGALDFPGDKWVLLALSTFIYGYGGYPFLKGFVTEVQSRTPGMMTLVAVAITVAYVYSVTVVFGYAGSLFFWETATLIDLMLLGHWIEMRSVLGASKALEELARLIPSEAHRVREDGTLEDVPIADLTVGDRVFVKGNERIPVDGDVVDGRSTVDESMLTGESSPVEKTIGSRAIAGSVNGGGTLTIEVKKTGAESYLNQVVNLVRSAQSTKSRTQDLANRAAFYLTVIALTTGVATFLAWALLTDTELSFAIERAVTVMIIACPHALGLAIPLVVAVSTSISARKGLLIRDRKAFEQARLLTTVVFDKTGTLTEGRFGVTDVLTSSVDESELLQLAASIELGSEHPIARGIVREAEDRDLQILKAENFQTVTGVGVEGTVDGRHISVISPAGIKNLGIDPSEGSSPLEKEGKTVVYVVERTGSDEVLLGTIALGDVIRTTAKSAIDTLHAMGIESIMLTGDRQEVGDYVAARIGIDRVIAEVLPDEKSSVVKKLQHDGKKVAMTGDGVNDAPALATADVGIAIGAGTEVAVETADIVLVDSDPEDVVRVIQLADATYKKMKQNLWYAAGYNIVAIPLAAGVLAAWGIILSPAVGAVLMSASTVVVAINARFLKVD